VVRKRVKRISFKPHLVINTDPVSAQFTPENIIPQALHSQKIFWAMGQCNCEAGSW
jgi:hypothetical protein